jgi:hypothetical protein
MYDRFTSPLVMLPRFHNVALQGFCICSKGQYVEIVTIPAYSMLCDILPQNLYMSSAWMHDVRDEKIVMFHSSQIGLVLITVGGHRHLQLHNDFTLYYGFSHLIMWHYLTRLTGHRLYITSTCINTHAAGHRA